MYTAMLWEEDKLVVIGALASAGARALYACAAPCGELLHPSAQPVRVLVVDDLPVHQHLIKAALQRACSHVIVETAGNGREAQGILLRGTEKFDIVLCDWTMPEMDGMELLAWMRETPAVAEVPFIMLSARDDEEDILVALQAGATGYLVKPPASKILCRLTMAVLADHRKEMP